MKLAHLASKLYPRWWREHYGDEFAALLDDACPGAAGAFDIAKGALTVQLTTWTPTRTILAWMTLGLAASVALMVALPPQYSAEAGLRLYPAGGQQSLPATVAAAFSASEDFRKNVRVSYSGDGREVRLSFDSWDPAQAQRKVMNAAARIIDRGERHVGLVQATGWRDVLDSKLDRGAYVLTVGTATGLTLGLLAALTMRRRRVTATA